MGTRIIVPILMVALFLAAVTPLAAASQNVLWQKTWGTSGSDSGSAVAVSSEGSIFVVGGSSMVGVVILKYASNGSLIWQEGWGGGSTNAVAADSSGGIYTAGAKLNATKGDFDALLLHLNSTGGLVGQKTWGGSGSYYARVIAIDSNGTVYTAGEGPLGVFLLKFNSTGGLIWQRTWGGSSKAHGNGVAADSLGNIYVVGTANSSGFGDNVFADLTVLKFNSTGSLLWGRAWGGFGYDSGQGVTVDAAGNVYVVGNTNRFGAGRLGPCSLSQKCDNVLLLKLDSRGSLLWQRTWGGGTGDLGSGVALDSNGGVYVTGITSSFTSVADVFLLKVDQSGNSLYAEAWGGKSGGEGLGVAADLSNNSYVTGYVAGAPPYPAVAVNSTVRVSGGSVVSLSNTTVGVPTIPASNPGGTVSPLHGSQTYAGSLDLFLFKYGYGKGVPISPTPVLVTLVLASTAFLVRRRHETGSTWDDCSIYVRS